MRIGRLTLDILGAIPVTEVRVRAWIDRPGNRIALLIAEMSRPATRTAPRAVARVSAWALATSDTADAATDRYPPLVEGATAPTGLPWKDAGGYIDSVHWRPQHDESRGRNRVLADTAGRVLVDDEPTTALQRLAMVVDSANGVGAALDPQKFIFMNTDTAVHLHRRPRAMTSRCGPVGRSGRTVSA